MRGIEVRGSIIANGSGEKTKKEDYILKRVRPIVEMKEGLDASIECLQTSHITPVCFTYHFQKSNNAIYFENQNNFSILFLFSIYS